MKFKITDEFSMKSNDGLLKTIKDNVTNFKDFNENKELSNLLNEQLCSRSFEILVNQLVNNGVPEAKEHIVYVIFDKVESNKARILISNEKRKNKKLPVFTCTLNEEVAYAY